MALPQAATAVDHGFVLILVSLVVLPVAALLFARAGAAWGEIGGGGATVPDTRPEKEAEVRQMVEARSYLRVRRGEPPLDVEAETERRCADFIGWDE